MCVLFPLQKKNTRFFFSPRGTEKKILLGQYLPFGKYMKGPLFPAFLVTFFSSSSFLFLPVRPFSFLFFRDALEYKKRNFFRLRVFHGPLWIFPGLYMFSAPICDAYLGWYKGTFTTKKKNKVKPGYNLYVQCMSTNFFFLGEITVTPFFSSWEQKLVTNMSGVKSKKKLSY